MDAKAQTRAAGVKHHYIHNSLNSESGGVQWTILKDNAPKRVTSGLLNELKRIQVNILRDYAQHKSIKYHVLSSDIPDVFSLGGDLGLFSQCVKEGDRQSLMKYAMDSIDVVYQLFINYKLPITTVSLVKGVTFGGGFEVVLACNMIIAEEQSTFSFPETRFGLFPGMGAYTFLRHRVAPRVAEEIIYSSKIYTAEELYQLGVIDAVCEQGQGNKTVMQTIQQMNIRHQGIHAMREMVQKFPPVDKQELLTIVEHWVDCVMQLSDKQLRLIAMLAKTNVDYSKERV